METPGESPDLIPPIFGIFKSVSINGVHNWTNHTVGKFLDPRQNWLQPEEFTKGNNTSRGKGVANSLLPWLNGWHGLWPQWCLELLEFICLHPSKYIASNFKDGQTKKGCLKNQGFMYIPGLISLISICKPLQIFRANFYHCILILYDQEWRIILLNFFHSYLFLKRTQYLHELDSYT